VKSREDLIKESIALERITMKFKKALYALVELKAHKDANGKDDYYEEVQPKVWNQAREALGLK